MLSFIVVERTLTVLALIVAGIVWLGKNEWAWPHAGKVIKWVKKWLPGGRNRILLEEIHHQLYPNQSSSVFDIVKRIENNQIMMAREMRRAVRRLRIKEDSDGIATFDTNEYGECIAASRAYCHLVGLPLNEVLRQGWKNIFVDEERERVYKEWSLAVEECRDFHMICKYRNNESLIEHLVKIDAYVAVLEGGPAGWMGEATVLKSTPAQCEIDPAALAQHAG